MKRTAKIAFIFLALTGIHAVLRLLYGKVVFTYETSFPHCAYGCDPPEWVLRAIQVCDTLLYFPSAAYPVLSDLLWGGIGLAVYLWMEAWRNAKRRRTQINQETQAKASL